MLPSADSEYFHSNVLHTIMNTKISIVVPVYNAQASIDKCITSIINQTYQNWELILVNDGSTDDSLQICKTYAMHDSRINVYTKENGGVSSARNLGLSKITGSLLTFVDSDDYVKAEYLSHFIEKMDQTTDLIISYAVVVRGDCHIAEDYEPIKINKGNFYKLFTNNELHWHTSPWGKCYRTDIIIENNLTFSEGMHIGEDAEFLFKYLVYTEEIRVTNDTDYCYYAYNENSLTKRIYSIESEQLAYTNINKSINTLIEAKQIVDPTALINLNWLKLAFQKRVINSLYHNPSCQDLRINILKSFDYTTYIKYIKSSKKDRLLNFFLKHKYFIIFDIIRMTKVKFRSMELKEKNSNNSVK